MPNLMTSTSSKKKEFSLEEILYQAQEEQNPVPLQEALTSMETSARTIAELRSAASSDIVSQTIANAQEMVNDAARINKAAETFGTNLDSSTNKIMPLSDELIKTQESQLKTLNTIIEKDNTKFLKDPIGWLVSKATIESDVTKYKLQETKAKMLANQIQTLNVATQQTGQTQALIDSTTNADTVARAARIAAFEATTNAEEAKFKYFQTKFQSLSAIRDLNDRDLDRAIKVKMFMADEEQRKFMRGQAELAVKEKLEDQAAEAEMLRFVNNGLAVRGIAPIGMGLFRTNKQLYSQAALDGMLVSAGSFNFGTSPGEAIVKLKSQPHALNNTASADSYASLDHFYEEAKREILSEGGKVTDDVVAAKINSKLYGSMDKNGKRIPGTLTRLATNMEAPTDGVKVNPYRIPDINTMVDSIDPGLKTSKFYELGLSKAVDAGVRDSSIDTLEQAALLAMQNGGDFQAVTSEFTRFIQKGVAANKILRQHTTYGLPEQNAYIVNGIDYTDPTEVKLRLFKLRFKRPEHEMKMFGLGNAPSK